MGNPNCSTTVKRTGESFAHQPFGKSQDEIFKVSNLNQALDLKVSEKVWHTTDCMGFGLPPLQVSG